MEWMGLVSRVEEDLERTISLGRLPEGGALPSEQLLARRYGVSRATVREALLRLSARGLVVRRQGRRTRAATLDEALTLENLGTVLHAEGNRAHPYRRRLLEGYLSLKRDITVELLASCCEQAAQADLDQLEQACLTLEEAARWQHERTGWVEQEFRLLRLAAGVANRPGHLLLIQSLERAFRGMAARVLPHLDSQAISQWARCAFRALANRDMQELRQKLLPLLQACDGRVLDSLAPVCGADEGPQSPPATAEPVCQEQPVPEPAREPLPGANFATLSACQTTWDLAPPTEGLMPESSPGGSAPPAGCESFLPIPSLEVTPPSRTEGSPLRRCTSCPALQLSCDGPEVECLRVHPELHHRPHDEGGDDPSPYLGVESGTQVPPLDLRAQQVLHPLVPERVQRAEGGARGRVPMAPGHQLLEDDGEVLVVLEDADRARVESGAAAVSVLLER